MVSRSITSLLSDRSAGGRACRDPGSSARTTSSRQGSYTALTPGSLEGLLPAAMMGTRWSIADRESFELDPPIRATGHRRGDDACRRADSGRVRPAQGDAVSFIRASRDVERRAPHRLRNGNCRSFAIRLDRELGFRCRHSAGRGSTDARSGRKRARPDQSAHQRHQQLDLGLRFVAARRRVVARAWEIA
jgi:hypothetical protein